MTRAVVLYELLSLDGFADDPGEGDWFDSADERLMDFLGEVISTQDTILLGRRTFDKWVPYWPSSTMQPFADFANTTRKIVFSSTPLTPEWAGAERAAGPADSVVADLKQRPGRDIGIHGSLSLARSLLAAGLVDELRLVMAPNLAGTGKTSSTATAPCTASTSSPANGPTDAYCCTTAFVHDRRRESPPCRAAG